MDKLLAKFLQGPPSETVQFKPSGARIESVARMVCGMLNQQGGAVVWGANGEGQIDGITNSAQKATELEDLINSRIHPRPLVSVDAESHQGKDILLINLIANADKPYSLDREIWICLGNKVLRAQPEQTAEFVQSGSLNASRWERQVCPGFNIDDCDTYECERTRQDLAKIGRLGMPVPTDAAGLMKSLYLGRQHELSNAAMVFFAKAPRQWAPNMELRLTRHLSDGEIVMDQMFEGPMIYLIQQAIATVQQVTGDEVSFPKDQLHGEVRSTYSLYSLREGLVNAAAHRDYQLPGQGIRVQVYPDHLIILNPGHLPDGWKPEDLHHIHESELINPDMAQVFYQRGLMEKMGRGTLRIIEECKNNGAPAPEWKVERHTVRLILYAYTGSNLSTESQLSDRQKGYFKQLQPDSTFTSKDYIQATGVSERQARRELSELVKKAIINRLGAGPSTRYQLIRPLSGHIRPS